MSLLPLKRAASINPEDLDEDTNPDYEFLYIDIGSTGRGVLTAPPETMTFGAAPSRARRVVRRGDTLISTVRTYLRAVWTATADQDKVIASTGFAVLRPGVGVDSRYLGWLASSDVVVEEVAARSVGVSYPAISPSELGMIKVPLPPLPTQRAIADYLDRETTRIDALIAAKKRMVKLLEERWQAVLEGAIQAAAGKFSPQPLKYACREIVVGIVITPSAWYAEEGVPAIRGLNVAPGRLSAQELVYLTPDGDELHRKSRLRPGDVVIVRTGQAGTAAVVPPSFDGANCIDLVIVRPKRALDSFYLEAVLNSDWMQKHIEEYSVGSIQSHFNVSAAKAVRVPLPPLNEQRRIVSMLHRASASRSSTVAALERQVSLLQEHRQALVTAAVTGELEIPEAA